MPYISIFIKHLADLYVSKEEKYSQMKTEYQTDWKKGSVATDNLLSKQKDKLSSSDLSFPRVWSGLTLFITLINNLD